MNHGNYRTDRDGCGCLPILLFLFLFGGACSYYYVFLREDGSTSWTEWLLGTLGIIAICVVLGILRRGAWSAFGKPGEDQQQRSVVNTVFLKGQSGQSYGYKAYGLETPLYDLPSNYIFAREEQGYWVPIYIGEAESLIDRLAQHEKMPCAVQNGITHIHVHVNFGGEFERLREESDLILNYSPICNRQ